MDAPIWSECASYSIRVRGTLDPELRSIEFPGFSMTHDSSGNTIQTGEVVDRAAPLGLFSPVRDLRLTG